MNPLFVSHSPVTNTIKIEGAKKAILGRWRKSVKTTKGIGGKIFANVFGDTKEEAIRNAEIVAKLPELLENYEKAVGLLAGIYAGENYKKENPKLEQEIYRLNDFLSNYKK